MKHFKLKDMTSLAESLALWDLLKESSFVFLHLQLKGAHRRLGITSVEQHFKLTRVIKHTGFTMENLKHDIALLQLKQPATLSDKVNVACLPTGDAAIGAKCYITGNV